MEFRTLPVILLLTELFHCAQTQERPKAAVTINPDNHVFIGEIVTLTCNIENGGGDQTWWYSWNKEGSDQTVSNDQQYRISDVTENHAGKYTCTGTETGGSRSSHPSDAVLLTVSARPKPTVRLKPQSFIYTGDTVTLTCDLNQSTGWTFFWNRNNQSVNPQISAAKITTNKLSEKLSNTGTTKYYCVALRQNYYHHKFYYSSEFSDPVTIAVEERPKPTVIINPDNHVFVGETVTLTCNIENGGGVQYWSYSWNKEGSDQTVSNDQQYRISDVTENHAGKYTCTGTETGGSRSSHPSDAVLLTVSAKPKPTVRLEPQNFIYTGDTVTLTCDLNQSTGWTFIWYRNGHHVNPQISADKITTNKLSEKLSNTGTTKYKCRAQRLNYNYKYYNSKYSDPVTVTVEERPKATVIINPDNHVFVGEIVTLTCNIENGGGVQNWRYSWNKGGSDQTVSNDQQYRISDVTENHAGKYTCTGTETGGSRSSHPSGAVLLSVSAKPKPTVRLEPQKFIYTGDTVTLTCDLNQSTGWTFIWYRNDQEVNPQISADKTTTNKLSEKLYYTGTTKYNCRAQRKNYNYSYKYNNYKYYDSEFSDPVTVTVEERPKPTVIINPDNHVFIGEIVTLTCNIENGGGVQNWRYSWNKEGSDQTVSNDQQYRISDVTENHAGKYTCTGTETGGSRSSHPSDAVLLTVSDFSLFSQFPPGIIFHSFISFKLTLHPLLIKTQILELHLPQCICQQLNDPQNFWDSILWIDNSRLNHVCVEGESSSVSLIISPSRTQHFTDESLSLSCVDQSKSTEWRVRRYTDDRGVLDCSSVSGSVRESTCNISSLRTSHTGVYWCESESGGSNPVNITVHGGDVILEIPVHPVTEGESLTLHCLHRKTKPSNPRADFYKDGSVVQNQTSGEMMIHHVSKSDEGFYHCKYPERGESPKSWVIIRVSEASLSVLKMISSAVAAFPYLLSTIILVKCYRAGAVAGELKLDAVVEAETSI
ncbi:titin-like [Trichomycterus rosablanca]|uniref:titin-like n=1 Tax=Trichomycterus rosablanca TaxID=2290929 RepID=UPI002F3542AD